jgi:predicted ATPase
MITRLEVDGFKSLRDFAVDLEPLTVFIGPNSAGKSNILDALALLSRLASQPVEEAFKHGRGRALDQFTRRGGETGSIIRFAVEVFMPGITAPDDGSPAIPNRCRYELTIERRALPSGAERLAIEDERLRLLDRAADTWLASHPEYSNSVEYGKEPRVILKQVAENVNRRLAWSTYHPEAGYETKEVQVPITHTILAVRYSWLHVLLASGRLGDESFLTAASLSSYRLIQLDAARLGEPSERIGTEFLAPDASNLPTVLSHLPGPLLGEIRADLVSLVPGISSFEIVPEGDSLRIDFELSGGEHLPARLVSDGTLRILALLTAFRVEPHPSVIGIEEPENGVYPGRLRKLLELLQEMTMPAAPLPFTQVILTTHSPVVLAAFRPQPQHLRFIDLIRRDGQLLTRARPVGISNESDRGRRIASIREIDELRAID